MVLVHTPALACSQHACDLTACLFNRIHDLQKPTSLTMNSVACRYPPRFHGWGIGHVVGEERFRGGIFMSSTLSNTCAVYNARVLFSPSPPTHPSNTCAVYNVRVLFSPLAFNTPLQRMCRLQCTGSLVCESQYLHSRSGVEFQAVAPLEANICVAADTPRWCPLPSIRSTTAYCCHCTLGPLTVATVHSACLLKARVRRPATDDKGYILPGESTAVGLLGDCEHIRPCVQHLRRLLSAGEMVW
jgi:hypothetical protein